MDSVEDNMSNKACTNGQFGEALAVVQDAGLISHLPVREMLVARKINSARAGLVSASGILDNC